MKIWFSPTKEEPHCLKKELQKGNVSLKLSALRVSDEGAYTCLIDATSWYDDITVHIIVEDEEWRWSVLVLIFKNKGDVQTCSNYRRIKLISHTMKLWEGVVLREEVTICEQQYGFMRKKSTKDAIFAMRKLIENYREGQNEVHCVFVDLKKANDRVPGEELWYCMKKSEKYVRVVQAMYEDSVTSVKCAVGTTDCSRVYKKVVYSLMKSQSDCLKVVGPAASLVAVAGEDLVLPCFIRPNTSAVDMTVEWFKLDEGFSVVHFYKDHEDKNENQAESYRRRTSMFKEELPNGNASLKLSALRVSDEGEYKCLIEDKSWSDDIVVHVIVEAVQIDPTLCNYHKAFAQERDVVAIKGSLLEKQLDQQYLIWTSMPILPTKSLSTKELDTLRTAGALDEPPSEQVMQNLKNICGSECRTEQLIETRATVFKKSYAYLQSVPFNEALLADLPLVLVENDTSLVKASQVVLTLSNATEFRPYLYPIQPKHAMFAEFFKKIGVEERPTVSQFCTVLEEIYTECSDKSTLQPNQLATVQRAVQQLFCLIKEDGKLTQFLKDTLYLPSTDGKLYESSMLFFNDTFFQANRLENSLKKKLKLLVKLHQCHLTDDPYEHQKLLQLLPKQSQPKLLSGVISVNLVGGQVEHCDYGSSCEFSGWFQKHLSSREFLHGLMCLIREQSKGTISQTEAAHMCESTFGKIQIVCCQALHTELLLNHQPLEGTAMETQVYVKKQEDECVFYLKHNDNMALKVVNEVNMYLTKEINALLENILNSLCLSVLGQLLLCENMEDVERALEQHGVRNTVSDEKGLGFRPNPGTPIQEEWHDSLDMDPLNSFEKGEYVGFCKDELENEYVFAIVVECLDKHSGETRQNPSRYRIQIGDEKFIDVSSLDLYQFKREKRSAPDGNATCTDIFELLSQSKPSESKPSQSKPSQSKSSQFEPFPKKSLPQTLEEAKIEIDQSLEQIWKMSDEDKSKAIRRLYLRWHPDKNPDNIELFTEAFKYLMNRIDELQHGKSKRNTSTQSNTTHSYNFRDFYEKWNYEAKSHKRGRERFYRNNFRQQYNFWSYFHETPKPNKEEAKRWYKQAECDLNAAQNDTGCNVYPEWCLFKVHQAVEKALIATEFRRNGQHPGTASTITCLAQKISKYATYLYDLPNNVIHLRALGVDAKRTQYPNFYPPPHIPNDRFKAADAQEAVNIATKLLRKLEIYITE
ncbi:sacsin [Silurus asotus]|uniref:Sacsin n=1 Tax=Silurus asotus TaxID=30991 RepID=A0AAD5B829_SILAS|nr:sacsin [Silurus asotus]